MTLKARSIKEKSDKLNFIKIIKLLLRQKHCQENEKTNYRLRGNIVDHICNKETESRTHRELSKLNNKTTQFKNRQGLHRHLTREDIRMTN